MLFQDDLLHLIVEVQLLALLPLDLGHESLTFHRIDAFASLATLTLDEDILLDLHVPTHGCHVGFLQGVDLPKALSLRLVDWHLLELLGPLDLATAVIVLLALFLLLSLKGCLLLSLLCALLSTL